MDSLPATSEHAAIFFDVRRLGSWGVLLATVPRQDRAGADAGWNARLAILRQDARIKFFDPLKEHGWNGTIDQEIKEGEYLILLAERAGQRHAVALLYSSGTSNLVYKKLSGQVEHIFINGSPYMIEHFAHGIQVPVSSADDFYRVLLEWNASCTEGRFAIPHEPIEAIAAQPPAYRMLLSEEPINAIWLRVRQLQSVTLARKLVGERAIRENVSLSGAGLATKAEGLAYALRNAADYYHAPSGHNLSQRVLNLYYGNMSLGQAEMLALPSGPRNLTEIEASTKQGHGLYTVDGLGDSVDQLVVGVMRSRFFPNWMKALRLSLDLPPEGRKKPAEYRQLSDLPLTTWLTVERLFAHIPEISDLYRDIFEGKPGWVTPSYDQNANARPSIFRMPTKVSKSYVLFIDDSARLSSNDIAAFPGPISEIMEIRRESGGRYFRVAVYHPEHDLWWQALQIHHSPFKRDALILPIFGSLSEYRGICIVLLYALSIVVRYRPGLWRRVQEGDLDHLRVLIEAFLAVVERVLPEQFLERITGQPVFAKQPGAFL